MAGDTLIGGGQSVRQSQKFTFGAYAPEALSEAVPAEIFVGRGGERERESRPGSRTGCRCCTSRRTGRSTPSCRRSGPWSTVQPINTPTWLLERNPYYYAVDTAGNQLPYIDRVQLTLAEDLEVINLRAMAGEYDLQERHIDLGKLPVILDNQDKGNYKVHLDLGFAGSDFDAPDQPELHGRSRDREMADQRRLPPRSVAGHRPRPAQRDVLARRRHARLAGARREHAAKPGPGVAQQVVDARRRAGQRDARRDRPDQEGRGRLPRSAPTMASGCASRSWPSRRSCRIPSWRRWSPISGARSASRPRSRRWSAISALPGVRNNEHHIFIWTNGGTELLYLFPRHAIPVDPDRGVLGPQFAQWYASGGKQGKKPDDPNLQKIFDLFRGCASQKAEDRNKNAQEIWKILVDQQYGIGTVGQSPASWACGWSATSWATLPRGCASRSIVARRAVRIRRRGTTRHDAAVMSLRARSDAQSSPRLGRVVACASQ